MLGHTLDTNNGERIHAIIQSLRDTDADIVALNEVWDDTIGTHIISEMKDVYPHVYKPNTVKKRFVGKIIGSGLILLSKYPIEDVHFIEYSESISTDALVKKGFICATVRTDDKSRVGVFITHMQAGEYQKTRKGQLRIFMNTLHEYRKVNPDRHIIVLGDLNIYKGHREYKVLQNLMKSEGLCDASLVSGKGSELDYIFSTVCDPQHVQFFTSPRNLNSQDRNKSFVSTYTYKYDGDENVDYSDHMPIMITIDTTGGVPPPPHADVRWEHILAKFHTNNEWPGVQYALLLAVIVLCLVILTIMYDGNTIPTIRANMNARKLN
jgi:endonuclease/exonuclease/phosphatase family metal-dependent hydrolase